MREGDKETLASIDARVRELNLAKMFVATPAWKVFADALSAKMAAVIASMTDVKELEKKAGKLEAYQEMDTWAKHIERRLVFLQQERPAEDSEGSLEDGGTQ
ncbi:MAG: hypothetical protein WC406_10380 [Methanoregula sp.]